MEDKKISRKVLIVELFITLIISSIIFIPILMIFPVNYLSYYKVELLYCLYLSFLFGYSISYLFLNLVVSFFEKRYLKKYENNSENIDFEYYREIIKNYSVATICSCYGKKIKIKDQLVATLLSLKLNDYIEINDEIKIKNEIAKYKSENMLIKALKGVRIFNKYDIKNQIDNDNYDDCMKSDLFIKDKLSSTGKLKDSMFNFDIILWIINFFAIFLTGNVLLTFIAFVLQFALLFILVIGGKNSKTIFVRNDKGLDIQRKLYGLKNYLKEFGNINERKLNEIELYDDYIIYAIIFDLKGNLNNEANDLYKKYIEKLIYK